MSRIETRFRDLAAAGRKGLVAFVTAGDPGPEATVPLMRAMVAAGADVIELGVPFSDPMADGPVIQRAGERALEAGMSLARVLDLVTDFRRGDAHTPVVLMGYLNPIETMGYAGFAARAGRAGVDGVITVDLPPEESDEFRGAAREHGLDLIYLLAPTSDEARIRRICAVASGFVYYVSLKGVTGSAALDVDTIAARVEAIKAVTDLPVGVGFGIRDAAAAARISVASDAVVVGTVLVERIESLRDRPDAIPEAVAGILRPMREAMDAAAAR